MIDELRRRARDFAARATEHVEGLGEDEAAHAALGALRESGLLAHTIPARDGGADAGALAPDDTVSVRVLCALREALAYESGMLDVTFVMQGLGSYPVAAAGSADLRAEVLPDVARGARVAALGLTEPEAGSALGELRTRARRDGDDWVLDGHKTLISNAGIADFYTVLARTSGEVGDKGGTTMFYVPADAPGVRAERFEVIAPHPIGDVLLEGVRVPDAHRLGEEGTGLDVALGTLGRFRTSVAAAANGFALRALDESRRHLSARSQFGKPLAANQALRFDLAEMDTRLAAARLLVDEAARLVDEEGPGAALAVARAKLYATETAGYVCDRAVQHLGGRGVRRGEMVEQLYRDVRALRIYEGTSEIQKLIIAREVLRRD